MVQKVLDIQQHLAEAVEPHHPLVGDRPIGMQIDADHVDPAGEEAIEGGSVGEQLGAEVDAAHPRPPRHLDQLVEPLVKKRITHPAQGERHITGLAELLEDALGQINAQRRAIDRADGVPGEDPAALPPRIQFEDDLRRQRLDRAPRPLESGDNRTALERPLESPCRKRERSIDLEIGHATLGRPGQRQHEFVERRDRIGGQPFERHRPEAFVGIGEEGLVQ